MRPRLSVALLLFAGAHVQALQPLRPLAAYPSSYVTLDGARIHYKSTDKGKDALVFVHGWTCDLTFWSAQVPALAARARLVLIDLPGHGLSDKPKTDYTMKYFARAVVAVLEQEHVERAVLIGHSMGAPVVRQALDLAPQRVRGLVLVDGSLRAFFKTKADSDKFLERFKTDYRAAATRVIDGLSGDMRPEDRERVKAAMLATPEHVALSAMENMNDPASFPTAPIGVPLAALNAASPYWDGYEAFLRGLNKDADYRVMTGVGHFLMIEKPAEFNALLLAVLRKQGFVR
jgi:pimeloyl-ACP methyl ester carboxylesterase